MHAVSINLLININLIFSPDFHCDVIQKSTEELQCQFEKLVIQTSEIILNKEIDVCNFKTRLLNLPIPQHREFMADIWSQINSETLTDSLSKLKIYWDFLNYTLLQHLVNKFGDRELKKKMKVYKKKLKNFRCKTHLCDFRDYFKSVGTNTEEQDTLMKFEVKLAKNWRECTLEDLETWKVNITQRLSLPEFIMKLESFGPGSVCITWTIPCLFVTSLVETKGKMDTEKMEAFYKDLEIISMKIDDEQCTCCPSLCVQGSNQRDLRATTGDDCKRTG